MSTIEWTDETWNPITGCKKVSPGCANCYAEGIAKRFWGERKFTDVQFHPERLEQPLKWRKPRMVFVNSMSDLFHESVTDEQLDQIFAVMALTPQHTYQVLTKRPGRMLKYFEDKEFASGSHLSGRGCWASEMASYLCGQGLLPYEETQDDELKGHGGFNQDGLSTDHVYESLMNATSQGFLFNVWLGVTVENQATAYERRIPLLVSAKQGWFTWVSHEPALEQVDFTGWEFIRWLVMGGESGPGARPFDIQWPVPVMRWAAENQVDFFLKQLGSNAINLPVDCGNFGRSKGKMNYPGEWPEDLRVRQMPSQTKPPTTAPPEAPETP